MLNIELFEKKVISFHKVDSSICCMGAMYRQENLTDDMCMGMIGKRNYMEIREVI
jgi:hypothetical protein